MCCIRGRTRQTWRPVLPGMVAAVSGGMSMAVQSMHLPLAIGACTSGVKLGFEHRQEGSARRAAAREGSKTLV